MIEAVTEYINKLNEKPAQVWQIEVCNQLRKIVHDSVPDVTEKLQYSKPHFLKNGKYAGVIGTAKEWVTYTIFNATEITAPEGLFEEGPAERKTIKIRKGQAVDYNLLATLIKQAASTQ